MNRGSPIADARADRTLDGFNEAPIHESGKCPCAAARALRESPLQ